MVLLEFVKKICGEIINEERLIEVPLIQLNVFLVNQIVSKIAILFNFYNSFNH